MKRDLVSTATFLAQTRLFGALSFNQLMILAARVGNYACPEGQVIFRIKDVGDSVYLIRAGVVRILLPLDGGRETTLALMYPGDLFGELSVLDGRPRSATAVAMSPVEALTLRRDHFLGFLRRQPEAAIRILGVLTARLRRTDELLGDVLFPEVPVRLAKRLLELADAGGLQTDQGIEIPLGSTRQELAASLGTTPSTLNHYLRIFRARGILQFSRSKVIILQPETLKGQAE